MAIAAAANTENEMFKTVYGDDVVNAKTEVSVLQDMFPMEADKALGKEFSVPVALSAEAGVTYLASDAATSINTAISAKTKEAKVSSSQIYLNGAVTKTAISRGLKSKASFRRQTAYKVMQMVESGRERIEWELLYGQDSRGLGVISAVAVASGVATITITFDSWAGGLWSGKSDTELDVFDGSGTQINTTAALVVKSANVASGTRQVLVTGASGDLSALAANQILFFRGQRGQQSAGLKTIASATSGTLFGIDVGVYDMFRGNVHAVGGAFSKAAMDAGVAKAVTRGLKGDAVLLVSTEIWPTLAAEIDDLVRYNDGAQAKKAELGTESIVVHYQRGKIVVMGHPLVRLGDAFLFQKDVLERVGSTDLTFDEEGKGEVFFEVPNTNYKGIKAFADQCLFCYKPSRLVYFSGITG